MTSLYRHSFNDLPARGKRATGDVSVRRIAETHMYVCMPFPRASFVILTLEHPLWSLHDLALAHSFTKVGCA